MSRHVPRQKPGESEQVVRTPPEFLAAVVRRFGPIRFDLAANSENSVAGANYFGPGSTFGEDALAESWVKPGVLWLNHEFGDSAIWTAKAKDEGAKGARVHNLMPAAVGSRWFGENVHRHALVLALDPRLVFVGHKSAYPKDLCLAVYGPWVAAGFDVWRWKEGT
jgi:hypothetical protein